MEDSKAPSRRRLNSIRSTFEEVANQLSKPVQFLQWPDENFFNQQISDVFSIASDLLKNACCDNEIEPKTIESPAAQVNRYKLQLEQLNSELDRRGRAFDTSITAARQIFADRLDVIQQEYKSRLSKLENENSEKEKELEAKLRDISNTFDARLNSEIAVHVTARNKIQVELEKLKNEYELTETTLKTSLNAAEVRGQLLEKQRQMLLETNSNVTESLAEKYKQQIQALQEQTEIRINNLAAENKRLHERLESATKNYQAEISRLTSELEHIEDTQKASLQALIDKQLVQFEKKKRKLQTRHQAAISKLQHEIEIDEMSSANHISLLKADIEQQKRLLADADQRYSDAIEALNRRTEIQLMEKTNEMKLIAKMQLKQLKQLAQKHELDIQQEMHNTTRQRQVLETKLQQAQRDGEANRRRLENEITALTRARDKFVEEMKKVQPPKEPKAHMSPRPKVIKFNFVHFVDLDVPPVAIAKHSELDKELQERIALFQTAQQMEQKALNKTMEAVKAQATAVNMKNELQKDEVKRKLESLEKQKIALKDRISMAQEQLDAFEGNIGNEVASREAALNQQIAAQHNTIVQLRDELASKKKDGVRKVDISIIQQEQAEELKKLEEQLKLLKDKKESMLKEIYEQNEKEIEEEEKKAKKLIDDLKAKYDAVVEATKKALDRTESLEEHDHWKTLRKQMADSNNAIFGVLAQRDVVSRSSAMRTASSPKRVEKSILPPLRKPTPIQM